MDYSTSLRRRISVLFSPPRLTIFIAAIVFAVVLNAVFIAGEGSSDWIGALSVVPLLGFAAWTIVTDYRFRREEKRRR